jgi:hypothetical protein
MKTAFRIYLLLVFCLLNSHLIAQVNAVDSLPVGPFLYTPPEGVNRWTDSSSSKYDYRTVSMNQLSVLGSTEDGLMVSFDMDLNLYSEENKPVITFSDSINDIINIRYSQRTITAKRSNRVNGNSVSYDYHLFDPLFEDTTGIVTWQIKVYFTSSFMFIVAGKKRSDYKYMSPLYFGLDHREKYPDSESIMYKYINRSSSAIIKLGDINHNYSPYISNIKINSIVYSNPSATDDWWRTLQREFSSPNPPHQL